MSVTNHASAQRMKAVSGRKRKPNRSVAGDILIWLMLVIVACIMALPLVLAISSSL